jgi:hypothetical protein
LSVWLLLTGFSLLMLWLYPTFIAPLFNKFKPLENQELKVKIDNLLERTIQTKWQINQCANHYQANNKANTNIERVTG